MNNPVPSASSRNSPARSRLLPFAASRAGQLAACLILGVVALSQSARSQNYATAVLADNPLAFWQLNETNDPSAGGVIAYDSTANKLNATYGTDSEDFFNGIFAPQPPTYVGFPTGQGALEVTVDDINSAVTLPTLNLNTNTVTIAMWINPTNNISTFTGLLMDRTTSDAAGFGFGGSTNAEGMAELGYTWNDNSSATYDFNSGVYPLTNLWQFAALVVQSNSATIYLYYMGTNGQPQLQSAANNIAHTNEAFNVASLALLGDDIVNGNAGDATRVFNGGISDAAVFKSSLTSDQILALFAAGVGVKGFAPEITGQPQSTYALAGSSAHLIATGINGTSPISYQWQLNNTNLTNNSTFSGVNSSILTISNVAQADVGTYNLIVTNIVGITTSSNATLTIQSPTLVGEWLAGETNFTDVSGFSPAGTHDAYVINGNYVFTNDVPLGQTGYSLFFTSTNTGLLITNSSKVDSNYNDTFDNRINSAFTVSCWSRGWPTTWSPWVSKFGETESGWQLRQAGGTKFSCFTVRDGGGGASELASGSTFGEVPWDDMSTTNFPTDDGNWHLYVGTFDTVSGQRCLYVDGQLAAYESSGNVPYFLAPTAHLCIGAKDSPPGDDFSNGSIMEIYDVRIYNYAITTAQVKSIYGEIPAVVNGQPQSTYSQLGVTAQMQAVGGGSPPLWYQWQFDGVNLTNGASFSGVNSSTLSILNVSSADAGTYRVIVTNLFGTNVSSNATLAISYPNLVGEWLNGSTNFADVSGFSPAGTHDGYLIGGDNYQFTNDVPAYFPGESLFFPDGASAIAITNTSSTLDEDYVNTFDNQVFQALTVSCWAKGTFGLWNGWPAWVSKYGDNGQGWQLRANQAGTPCWTVRDNNSGVMVTGSTLGWDGNDDLNSSVSIDGKWHLYTGTYSAVTGIRILYVDGQVQGLETNNVEYFPALSSHVCIGAQDAGGNNFDQFMKSTMEIYDARIYNYALTQPQVQQLLVPPAGTRAQIGQQPPASISTVCEGITVWIGALEGGSAPLTNQWRFNGVILTNGNYGGVIISGANSAVLTIANVTTNFDGVYTLAVSNAFGGTVSSNATLTVGVLATAPPPATNLVGAWLTGPANFADTSGYSPAGTHDASLAGGSTDWTNDVPPPIAAPGSSSLYFNSAGLMVSNSSSLAKNYVNTYDDVITNSFTVMCWGRGYPGGWNPWVSKYGENGVGWQLRVDSWNTPCFTIRGTGGTEDMAAPNTSNDGFWHHYAGTYDLPSGVRNLYVDGVLVASQSGQGEYKESEPSYLMIGAKDSGGDSFGNWYTGEIYGVYIYNTALSQAQVNSSLVSVAAPPTLAAQVIKGSHGGNTGGSLVLTWSQGNLLQATNLAGPWTTNTLITSPYTNAMTNRELFFKVVNP